MAALFANCLLPQAIDHELTYAVPDALAASVRPGMRVVVPLRAGRVVALVTALAGPPPRGVAAKPLLEVLDAEPLYDASMLAFLRWVGDYYLCPAGLVLRAALPGSARKPPTRARTEEAPAAAETPAPYLPVLTAAQQAAVGAIGAAVDAGRFAPFLLHGVTGSGKTEVYLRATERALAADRSVLVLVPEITLAHQIVRWFEARFANRIVVLHSRLTEAERARAFTRAAGGPAVVVGARSAVFAPLKRPGLIVLDEEHEAAYKQDDAVPFYHARECALMRGKLQGCPVVLGSATPSLETARQARAGHVTLLELPERIDRVPMPAVEILPAPRRSRDGVLGPRLADALRETVARGEQALLFLNRRGFAPALLCVSCGAVPKCRQCSTSLVLHLHDDLVKCHWCGETSPPPRKCARCGGEALRALGLGTQRVESEVRALLPAARLVRMDGDTTRQRLSHGRLLGEFADGDVLIGTQMVAKGLDFPRLTLVGVVLADLSLHLPDFRAAERTFQLLTQVAGRAGRREIRGRVIVQAVDVEHPAIVAAAVHDYWKHYDAETAARRELGYPPFGRLVRFRIVGARPADVEGQARRLAAALVRGLPAGAAVLGPAPAYPAVVAKRHRWHLVLKGPAHADVRGLAKAALAAVAASPHAARVQVSADVDPVNVMS